MRRCLLLAFVIALLPRFAEADDVLLRGGGRLSGRILERTDTSITVDVGPGTITVPLSSVLRIEEHRTVLHEYEDRAGVLGTQDAAAWVQLGRWAADNGLNTQARVAFLHALTADPDSPDANAALGRVRLDGRWVTEEESYRLRGYVPFEGRWITVGQFEAILEREAAQRAAELANLEAMHRVREAEARAVEAEARAREAEAVARRSVLTLPLWWGAWGTVPRAPRTTTPAGHTQSAPIQTWPPLLMGPSSQLGVWPSTTLGVWPSQSLGVWSASSAPWTSQPVAAPVPNHHIPRDQPRPRGRSPRR